MPAFLAARRVTRTPCSPWSALSMVSASLSSAMASSGEMGSVGSQRMKMSPSDKGILLRITAFLPTGRSSQAADYGTERTPPHPLFYRKTGAAMASVCISETWKPTAPWLSVSCHRAELKPCFWVWSRGKQSRMLSTSA